MGKRAGNPVLNERIRKRISQLMEEKDLTPSYMEQTFGIKQTTFRDFLNERSNNPQISVLYDISQALGVDVAYLLIDEEKSKGFDFIYRDEYQQFLRDENFREYFKVAQMAFNKGVPTEALTSLVQALAVQQKG
jgi:transcriptional regulator with XRE-family HTH domain